MNRPRRVLLADDEPHVRRLIQVNIEKAGWEVVPVENGQQALDKLRLEEFDLAILDVMMPYMDGLEVLRRLRRDPKTAELVVVLLTVKAQDEDLFEGYRAGADIYLTKPFNPEELIAVLNRIP